MNKEEEKYMDLENVSALYDERNTVLDSFKVKIVLKQQQQ